MGSNIQCFRLLTAVLTHFSKPKGFQNKLQGRLFACFIDFKKAYDSVDHQLLWKKLVDAGISSKVLALLKSMYKDIKCRVKSRGLISEEFLYTIGVRQGFVLSPLLFNLFINDISDLLKKERCGISVGDALIYILLYADDIVLTADNEHDLQKMINKLQQFCSQSGMHLNVPKTKWMVFEKRKCTRTSNLSLTFSGNPLERVEIFKYLGVYFTSNMIFTKHVSFTLIKAEKASHLFWKYTSRFRTLQTSVLLNLFHSLVVPILLYCAEIWFPCISQKDIDC